MHLEQSGDFRSGPSGGEHAEDFRALRLGEFRPPPAVTACRAGRFESGLGALLDHFALVFRMLQAVKPWGMVEVLMLGVLVSVVKLADSANIVVGNALWALAALMMIMSAISVTFDARVLWAKAIPVR